MYIHPAPDAYVLCEGGIGHQAVGLSIMLSAFNAQQWFKLPEPGAEEALYESSAVRRSACVAFDIGSVSDERTTLRLRHLLEKHETSGLMSDGENALLEAMGIKIQAARS